MEFNNRRLGDYRREDARQWTEAVANGGKGNWLRHSIGSMSRRKRRAGLTPALVFDLRDVCLASRRCEVVRLRGPGSGTPFVEWSKTKRPNILVPRRALPRGRAKNDRRHPLRRVARCVMQVGAHRRS